MILFIRMRLLGDIVFTIPAVQMYRNHFPESEMFYLVEERFREAAEIIPGIKEVIDVPDKMGGKDIYRFRKKIKKLEFPTVVDFHSGPRSALLTWLSGAQVRIGYRTPNRNWAYTHLVPRKTSIPYTHSVYNQARLLAPLGMDTNEIPPYPEIHIDQKEISERIRTVSQLEKTIVIHVGAKNKYRDWGLENFTSLVKNLRDNGFSIFLIGKGEMEEERGKDLEDKYQAYDFTGKLSIQEILYLISHSDVYFGADSGPLQLASLTPTPIVALYGPNLPEVSGPYRKENVKIIQLKLDCIPCDQKSCPFEQVNCMAGIQVDDVYQAITEQLSSSESRSKLKSPKRSP